MRQYPEFRVEGAYVTRWPVGGTGGSWITHRTFDKLTAELVDHLANMPKLDGIYLPLHGGMAVEGIPKPEAEIVRRIRKRLGDIPIAVTLDLHANEDHELTDAADIVLSVKRYPHYDYDLMGKRAADVLVRTIRGDFKPVTETRKPGIVFASIYGATHKGIPQDVMERARRWENQYLDVFVSVLWGFAYADAADGGVTVIALTNNQPELARKIADDMNDYILKNKEKFEYPLPRPKQAIRQSLQAVKAGMGPVILADLADRIGDSTHILHELDRRKVRNFALASIADPKAVSDIVKNNKVGDKVTIEVGGYSTDLAGVAG
jgi:microcystin degradation protein MlrC